jgi:hypothetical protein
MKNKKLPKWFSGELYQQGGEVTNPFSGESYELNAQELSMYDFIIGCQVVFARQSGYTQEIINDFDKALSWFRTNNSKAYMVLLD